MNAPRLRSVTLAVLSASSLAVLDASHASAQSAARAKTETPSAAKPTPTSEQRPKIDPKATAVLDRSRAYIASLGAFRLRADTSRDVVVGDGYKVEKLETIDLLVQRPNRMRIDAIGDDRDQLVVLDGQKLTIFSRPQKYFATMTALPTVSQTLDVAEARYGVQIPLADIIAMNAGGDLGKGAEASRAIGKSRCGPVQCEHLAFRAKNVDWQIWIEDGDKPVPRRIVVTTRHDPTHPRFAANLAWDVAPKLDEADFRFTPPAGASEMALPRPGSNKTDMTRK